MPETIFADEAALWAELSPVVEAEIGHSFDELLATAIEQPDNEIVIGGLKQMISKVQESGYIGLSMQMAMTIGAAACMHSHMESAATEVSTLFTSALDGKSQLNTDNEYGDTDNNHEYEHDVAKCKNCQNGKQCSKR